MEVARKKKLKKILKRPAVLGALGILASLFPMLIARIGGLFPFLLALLSRIIVVTAVHIVIVMSALTVGHAVFVSNLSLVIIAVVGFFAALGSGGDTASKQMVVVQAANSKYQKKNYHDHYRK